MLIDTHVHLNADQFKENVDEVIKRALNEGVGKMIVIGFDKPTNLKAIELAEKYDFIYATVGYHPTEATHIKEEDFELLKKQLTHKKVVGIGECGLDLYWDKDHLTEQTNVFTKQINLSKEFNLPLIIHMRDASKPMIETLRKHAPLKGIMHCYSGSAEMVDDFIDLGLHISLGGPVTFKNGHKPKAVAKVVPLDKLLVETDSPYLSPHPYRGKTNEPARVKLVAEAIAEIKSMTFNEISDITTKNAEKLFGI
jgi:TatD DNase family protein